MTTFDDREHAFENKFAHDAEMQFRAEARRNRLLGLWAAEMLGKKADEASEYAAEVVKSDFQSAESDRVLRKVSDDLGDRVTDEEVRAKMDELLAAAKGQIVDEVS